MAPQQNRRAQRSMAALAVTAAWSICAALAQSGDPDAQYLAAFSEYQKGEYAAACKGFQDAAAQGQRASQSMIQMINGTGHPCAMRRAGAPAPTLPDIRALAAGARAEARAWRGDAVLTLAQVSNELHPGYYSISFLFVSPSARETLSLVGSQFGGLVGSLGNDPLAAPLPDDFIDLAAAIAAAQRAGMRGAPDDATLSVWGARGGRRLPGWLLHSPGNDLETFLVGAVDGRAYAVSRDSYPLQGDDGQIQAMRQAMRLSATPETRQSSPQDSRRGDPCSASSMAPMSSRLAPWAPCNRAAVARAYRQSNSNYALWRAGKRATPD